MIVPCLLCQMSLRYIHLVYPTDDWPRIMFPLLSNPDGFPVESGGGHTRFRLESAVQDGSNETVLTRSTAVKVLIKILIFSLVRREVAGLGS